MFDIAVHDWHFVLEGLLLEALHEVLLQEVALSSG